MYIKRTDRIILRFIKPEDWSSLQAIWNDFNKSPLVIYDIPHDTTDEVLIDMASRWAKATICGTDHLFFAVCIKNTMIGFFSINCKGDYHDLGYGFLNKFQGKGYAQESLAILCEYLKEIGIVKLQAGTALENKSSTQLLEKIGFKLIATEEVSFHKDISGSDIIFIGGIYEKML